MHSTLFTLGLYCSAGSIFPALYIRGISKLEDLHEEKNRKESIMKKGYILSVVNLVSPNSIFNEERANGLLCPAVYELLLTV
jgi:hypothetical protein